VKIAAQKVGILVTQPQARLRNLPGWLPTLHNLTDPKFKNRKADWFFNTADRSFAVDVTCTGAVSDVDLQAAADAMATKYTAYARNYTYPHGGFLPLALETHGGMHAQLTSILSDAHKGEHVGDYDKDNLHYGLTTISVALCKVRTLYFSAVRHYTTTSPHESAPPTQT
jgi:hypothetical protein